jgi:hypothetical protein
VEQVPSNTLVTDEENARCSGEHGFDVHGNVENTRSAPIVVPPECMAAARTWYVESQESPDTLTEIGCDVDPDLLWAWTVLPYSVVAP